MLDMEVLRIGGTGTTIGLDEAPVESEPNERLAEPKPNGVGAGAEEAGGGGGGGGGGCAGKALGAPES